MTIGMGYGMHQGLFGFQTGIVLQILIIVAIFLIVYWIFKNNNTGSKDSALEILRKKYVKGEISKKKFLELKKDLI